MRNKVNKMAKTLQARYHDTEVAKLYSEDSGKWWRSIKLLAGMECSDSSILTLANNLTGGDLHDLAEMANDYFVSVSQGLNRLTPSRPSTDFNIPDKYIISVSEVQDKLLKINTKKAVGPDYLPNWVLKDFADILAGPVASIFNASLSQATVPGIWKSADVIPLPKVKPPTQVEKHLRPIALTPILAKMLEGFVCKWMEDLCPENDDPLQFGCVKGTSTTHCLIELLHIWCTQTDTPDYYVRILLVDFSRAFDHIDHTILLDKWSDSEVPPFLIRWKHDFLCERRQRVRIGSYVSKWKSPDGGTPQGTKSGPRDFKKMVKDMRAPLPLYKYVDDTTLSEVCKRHVPSSKLQESADDIVSWCVENKMIINEKKTKEMIINFAKKPSTIPDLLINDQVIERVSSTKLLGVTISKTLSWEEHINNITGKASQRLYFLRLLKRANVNMDSLLRIYCSLIRPTVEYACQLWHGGLTGEQSDTVEAIQIRALAIIMPDAAYDLALQIAELPTLADRRRDICRKLFIEMQSPSHKLHHLLPSERDNRERLRSEAKYPKPKVHTKRAKSCFVNWCLFNLQ